MKKSSPWYWETRNSWYVKINGQRHLLGTHPENAAKPQKSRKTGRWNSPTEIDEALRRLLNGGTAVPSNGATGDAVATGAIAWAAGAINGGDRQEFGRFAG